MSTQLAAIGQRIILLSPDVAPRAGHVDYVAVDYADVNHDGQKELLIQHRAGMHGTTLRVMGYTAPTLEFEQIALLGPGTPEGLHNR